jgi:MauM/NapG family ferredoxin protein
LNLCKIHPNPPLAKEGMISVKLFMLRKIRIASQAIFLLLFLWLFLQTESKGADELGYPVKIFLDADPLIFITTLLASHEWIKTFFLAVFMIIATVILGRVFCGWVCPLGTLHNLVGTLQKSKPRKAPLNLHWLKYCLLIFLITTSLFSLQVTGIFDPLSLLIRSLSLAVYPLLSYATRATFDILYNFNVPVLVNVSEFVYTLFKKLWLPFQQPYFLQSFLLGALFFIILGLNLLEKRFWCKYLCPLGALLGLLSRFAVLQRTVSEGCNSCGACTFDCQGNAAPEQKEKWHNAECLVCLNCDDLCPQNGVGFGFLKKPQKAPLDLGKRRVLGMILSGIVAVPLVRITGINKQAGAGEPRLIRPPGSLEEKQFLAKCVKCGECMKVCITNGLQPTLMEAGLEGIWSPVLVPRIGYCEYRCTLCGQVCPTGAIKKLELPEKEKVKIGLAMIDKGRCLPYAHAMPCIVCQEVCPTPKKAIWLTKAKVENRNGNVLNVNQPHVDLELCIGCGLCEAKCPILGQPAIYVTSIGETRSKDNQLLLS